MPTETNQNQGRPAESGGVAELLAAGKALGAPITVAGRAPGIVLPEHFTFTPLPPEELPPLPDHIRQGVTLVDAASFAAYINRFKDERTMIFASLPDANGAGSGFKAVVDYHRATKVEGRGSKDEGTSSAPPTGEERLGVDTAQIAFMPVVQPQRCAHVVLYPCPLSKPWLTWLGASGKAMSQADFLEFIDQNARGIVSPAAADLLTFVENFSTKTDVIFANKIDRVSGRVQLTYTETEQDGGGTGKIPVPEVLGLRIPVFEGGKLWDVEGRFRWKVDGAKLKVTMQLYRTDDVLRSALEALRDEIATATGIVPLNGAPEVRR